MLPWSFGLNAVCSLTSFRRDSMVFAELGDWNKLNPKKEAVSASQVVKIVEIFFFKVIMANVPDILRLAHTCATSIPIINPF